MSIFKNGNTIVEIKRDGTKIRYTPDNQTALPEIPESIDLSITSQCKVGCPHCHERSVPVGIHGNLKHPLLGSIQPYTELAIGGGDPMEHPDLETFLLAMKARDVICNLTVHWTSFMQHYETLKKLSADELIHGLGVSINETVPCDVMDRLCVFPNAVVHTILGVADEAVYRQLANRDLNVLILGYKTFGKGTRYRADHWLEIGQKILWLRQNIHQFPDWFKAVSFDNLSVEQLDLKRILKPEVFDLFYMGGDGTFTMYVDLAKEEFASSSTSERHKIDSDDIRDLFRRVRKNNVLSEKGTL